MTGETGEEDVPHVELTAFMTKLYLCTTLRLMSEFMYGHRLTLVRARTSMPFNDNQGTGRRVQSCTGTNLK